MTDEVLILVITGALLVALHLRLSYIEARTRRLVRDFLNDPERIERQGKTP